ncbi:hypothetical protein HCJ57_15480 [Listeria booriae]|uniref:hypothetical protein n=1 Tax=Listeria booriae TaxID=1552123 RepID=UPI0016235065|nr:hypothetical protein [Listeria booriae]MBC1235491.1 hypothetical protein [Listeria booriae]MBC1248203.1 hypothetical protein [Listeria booriae]MBC1274323.1 hypothetical protein [Listeria booriae]MBC2057927.1 hypothetical protein [Listeria booriae]
MDKIKAIEKDFLEGMSYKQLGAKYEEPISTIKTWKSRGQWKRAEDVIPTPGAPIGNKNAKNNKGGGAPGGNKNAVKTGEYERFSLQDLPAEDYLAVQAIPKKVIPVVDQQLEILQGQQIRMIRRLRDLEDQLGDEKHVQVYERRKVREYQSVTRNNKTYDIPIEREEMVLIKEQKQTSDLLMKVLAVEDALTRISNQLTKLIQQREALIKNSASQLSLFDAE